MRCRAVLTVVDRFDLEHGSEIIAHTVETDDMSSDLGTVRSVELILVVDPLEALDVGNRFTITIERDHAV